MSLDISQLQNLLAGANFYDFEQLNKTIVRSTRKDAGKAFAVYYFDISQKFPNSKEKLSKYQDQVIGRHYFDGRKSLQWNNYLYFIITPETFNSCYELLKTKELIEKDRIYARKFVIFERELDSILEPKIIKSSGARPHASILSVWIEQLAKMGIDNAVLCDESMPKKLEMIESSISQQISKKHPLKPTGALKDSPFICELKLKHFRNFPIQRKFEFGKVNLITGPNGTGKTSLFEAIELFYCGKNKRSEEEKSGGEKLLPYNFIVKLSDGKIERATHNRSLQLFRDRNLNWYGQSEIKTTNLYQSFSRFNFLDTDAAVSISDSASRIDENLSKLLVGPDASKAWRNIERVHEALISVLKELQTNKVQMEEELESIEKSIKEANKIPKLSGSIQSQLVNMLQRVEWDHLIVDKEALASKLIEMLSELEALIKQAIEITWIKEPVSINKIEKYCQETKAIIQKAKDDANQLEEWQKKQKDIEKEIKKCQNAIEIANQAKQLIESGIIRRIEDIEQQKNNIAHYSDMLAGYDEDFFTKLLITDSKKSIASNQEKIKAELNKITNLLAFKKNEYRHITELHDRSLSLSQELRQIATRILQESGKPDECPLCHTSFAPGELLKRLEIKVGENFEKIVNSLLSEKRKREAELKQVSSEENALIWLEKFCERSKLSSDASVDLVLFEIKKTKKILNLTHAKFEALKTEIRQLESQGFSSVKVNKIKEKLSEIGSIDALSKEVLENVVTTFSQKNKKLDKNKFWINMQIRKLRERIEKTVELIDIEDQGVQYIISKLNKKFLISNSILNKLEGYRSSFPWPVDKPVVELLVEFESIRKVSTKLLNALRMEKQAKSNYSDGIKRKEQIVKNLNKLNSRIEQLSKAKKTLSKIQRQHSLKSAMDEALRENRASIEAIFSQIHSPAEFAGIGLSLSTLLRKENNKEASLSEISTGQRAAFALSIFLAQNAHISNAAPPVILIDDPIAHVDDLNSLSFLDYLREIALSGKRQIFFSTASNKLATLFERKFDFMGSDEFKKFKLERTYL